MNFKEIDIQSIKMNPFTLIGEQWMLISAKKDDVCNTMTASWGGLGVLWSKNVVSVYIRPQRYTNEFVDGSNHFTLSFFDESYKKTLAYLGRVSGRDEDKIAKSELTLINDENMVAFEEAELIIVCKKIYKQQLMKDCFIDDSISSSVYPDDDFHYLYVGEIEKIYVKEK